MVALFKHAAHLKGKNGKGRDYPCGNHDVPAEHQADPHFHRLVKAGLIVLSDAVKAAPAESLQERNKRLAEKLAPKVLSTLPAGEEGVVVAPPSPPAAGENSEKEVDGAGDESADEKPADESAPKLSKAEKAKLKRAEAKKNKQN